MENHLDIQQVRNDFPILTREVHPGVPLVYLDSTATSQKPLKVIEAMNDYYRIFNGNIHRGVHTLAEEATAEYENARAKIARFINARKPRQIIYTRNTTESINLVAQTWGRKYLSAGDLVILTEMEHHSNLVPWQILSEEKSLRLEFIPVDDNGQLDLARYDELLIAGSQTRGVYAYVKCTRYDQPCKRDDSQSQICRCRNSPRWSSVCSAFCR